MFDPLYHEELMNELLNEARSLDDGRNTSQIQRIEWIAKAVIEYCKSKPRESDGDSFCSI